MVGKSLLSVTDFMYYQVMVSENLEASASNTGQPKRSWFDIAINFTLVILLLVIGYRYIGLLYPSTRVESPARAQVIMYATSWCPFCIEARGFFARKGIRYFEYNIDKSSVGMQQFQNLGGQGVPLMVIGDIKISGLQKSRILTAVRLVEKKRLQKEKEGAPDVRPSEH